MPQPPIAINSFVATPSNLEAPGTTIISWDVSNAEVVTLDGVPKDPVGMMSVMLDRGHTFTLLAIAGLDSVEKTIGVTVTPKAVIDYFTATPASLPAGGGNVTLAWSCSGGTLSVMLNGFLVPLVGSKIVNQTATKTHVLLAAAAGGITKFDRKTLTVNVA